MSTSGGKNKDDPYKGGNARDTTPIDPRDLPENEMAALDAGWDLGSNDLLGPDEGPTVVDGSLEMAAAEAAPEVIREPSRTYLGMGPADALAPMPEEMQQVEEEEVTEVSSPALEEPGPVPPARSPLASLAAQDMAFKDTMPGGLDQLSRPPPVGSVLAPEPAVPPDTDELPPVRPPPPPTELAVQRPRTPVRTPRAQMETEPTEPILLPKEKISPKADADLALAATIAPGDHDLAHAPTLAPDPEFGLNLDASALPPEPQVTVPSPPAPSPNLDESTQTVKPIAQKPRTGRAPSNLMLTVLWVLALVSVVVAVALYLLRPSI